MISREYGTRAEEKGGRLGTAIRFFATGLLLFTVLCETYCLFLLRGRVTVRSDELKNLSMQLQSFRNESAQLHEELSSIKYTAGEDADGNPSFR